jgi:hypothetical protein
MPMPPADQQRMAAALPLHPATALPTPQAVHGEALKLLDRDFAIWQVAVHRQRHSGALRPAGLYSLRLRLTGAPHSARRKESGHAALVLLLLAGRLLSG